MVFFLPAAESGASSEDKAVQFVDEPTEKADETSQFR
jgi:hypothetical protein